MSDLNLSQCWGGGNAKLSMRLCFYSTIHLRSGGHHCITPPILYFDALTQIMLKFQTRHSSMIYFKP